MKKYSKWLKFHYKQQNECKLVGRGFCRSKNIIIPNKALTGFPVTRIEYGAFKNDSCLESIVIPVGVTSIGSEAFKNCTNLKSVVLPNGLKEIGQGAFAGCTLLTEIQLPDSLTTIEKDAFRGCKLLKSANIRGVDKIENGTFNGCEILSGVEFSEKLWSVGDYAFANCRALKSVNLKWVRSVGEGAFKNCTSLIEITLPYLPGEIGIGAFDDCGFQYDKKLWKDQLLIVDDYVIGCSPIEGAYKLGNNIKCILRGAFDNAKKVVTVKNENYQQEKEYYDKRMYEYLHWCEPRISPEHPGAEPQEYYDKKIPIKIEYDGTLLEWDMILRFVEKDYHPYEIIALDGLKCLEKLSYGGCRSYGCFETKWNGKKLRIMQEIRDQKYGKIWEAYLNGAKVYIINGGDVVDDTSIIDELDNAYGIPVRERNIVL